MTSDTKQPLALTQQEFARLVALPWKTIKDDPIFKQTTEQGQLALYLQKHPGFANRKKRRK